MEGYHSQNHAKEHSDQTVTQGEGSASPAGSGESTPGPSSMFLITISYIDSFDHAIFQALPAPH